ncbi:unnamed protein product [Arctogadus glacialis]
MMMATEDALPWQRERRAEDRRQDRGCAHWYLNTAAMEHNALLLLRSTDAAWMSAYLVGYSSILFTAAQPPQTENESVTCCLTVWHDR